MKWKGPKSTLMADNTQGLITTKQKWKSAVLDQREIAFSKNESSTTKSGYQNSYIDHLRASSSLQSIPVKIWSDSKLPLNQQSWFWACLFHKLSNFIPPVFFCFPFPDPHSRQSFITKKEKKKKAKFYCPPPPLLLCNASLRSEKEPYNIDSFEDLSRKAVFFRAEVKLTPSNNCNTPPPPPQ